MEEVEVLCASQTQNEKEPRAPARYADHSPHRCARKRQSADRQSALARRLLSHHQDRRGKRVPMTPWQAGSFSCLIPPVFHLHYSKQPQEARTVPDCIAYWDIESSLTAKQPLKPTFDPFRKQPPGFSASHTVRELVMSESPAEMSDGPCERMIVLDEVSNTLAASVPRPDLKTFLHT